MEKRWFRGEAGALLAFSLILTLVTSFISSSAQQSRDAKDSTSSATNVVQTKAAATTSSFSEDWSLLSVAGSTLEPTPPILGEKADYPEFTLELLQVKWRPNDPIDLYVILPKGVKNPPAVLYLYGYPSETDRFRDEDFSKLLIKNGIAAIGFVSALTGHRYHDRPWKEWFISELQESLVCSVHDVQMILNYLQTRGDLDMDRIGMFGDGSGATIAILAASVDKRIKVLDLLEPWGDWPDWLSRSSLIPEEERANYLKPDFLKRVELCDPVKVLPQLRSQTIRLQVLPYENLTPPAARERIIKAMPPTAKIVRYEDSKALKATASSGGFFDWVQQNVRVAIRGSRSLDPPPVR